MNLGRGGDDKDALDVGCPVLFCTFKGEKDDDSINHGISF